MTLPSTSKSGPPLLPGIDEGVGLEVILVEDIRRGRPEQIRAALAAHPAAGEGVILAEGRADRADELPHLQRIAIAHLHGHEIVRLDLDDRDVRLVVGGEEPARKHAAFLQPDAQLLGIRDHVVIRQNVAIGADHEARGLGARRLLRQAPRARRVAAAHLAAALFAVLRKRLERLHVFHLALLDLFGDVDHHHARRDLFVHLHEALLDQPQERERRRLAPLALLGPAPRGQQAAGQRRRHKVSGGGAWAR